jgi:hypothetical protein
MKKNDFSSHKLPKQQSTSFWSQGILGVKVDSAKSMHLPKPPTLDSFLDFMEKDVP